MAKFIILLYFPIRFQISQNFVFITYANQTLFWKNLWGSAPPPPSLGIRSVKRRVEERHVCRKVVRKECFVVCEETYLLLTSSDGKHTEATEVVELRSSQEEADTLIVLHCKHMAAELSASLNCQPADLTIVVRSPDTDVFILLLSLVKIFSILCFSTLEWEKTTSSRCT